VLLPQVATQYGWSREKFLAEICRKAGLPEDAWRDKETRLFAFEAEVFSDSSLAV
jgi:AMMECR1 domain-containing protein